MFTQYGQKLLTEAYHRWYAALSDLQGDIMTDFYYNELKGFDSTALDLAGYNYEDETLYIKFNKGGEYIYEEVPYSVFQGLIDAPSAGTYYRENISGKFAQNSYYHLYLRPTDRGSVPEDSPVEDLSPDPETTPLEDFVAEQVPATAHQGESFIPSALTDRTVLTIPTLAKNRYGIDYSYGDNGMTAYYKTEAVNENEALLNFHGDVEQSEKVFPGLVTNVKVKSITRYFD